MITLSRIDDRLIHGQMVTKWLKVADANCCIVIDDGTAKDKFASQMCKMVAPRGVEVEVLNAQDAIKMIKDRKIETAADSHVVLLFKGPEAIENLVDGGVSIKKVILGGMGSAPGRKKFWKTIYVSEDDKECMKRLINKGVDIVCQLIPEGIAVSAEKYL